MSYRQHGCCPSDPNPYISWLLGRLFYPWKQVRSERHICKQTYNTGICAHPMQSLLSPQNRHLVYESHCLIDAQYPGCHQTGSSLGRPLAVCCWGKTRPPHFGLHYRLCYDVWLRDPWSWSSLAAPLPSITAYCPSSSGYQSTTVFQCYLHFHVS